MSASCWLVAKVASERQLPSAHTLLLLLWLEAICCLPVAVRPSASERWRRPRRCTVQFFKHDYSPRQQVRARGEFHSAAGCV